jgi:hypothetical protein
MSDVASDIVGTATVLNLDGRCPRVGLIKLDGSADATSSAVDSTDVWVKETPAKDEEVLLETSGGQDNMPRHLRVLVGATICGDVSGGPEEAVEVDKMVNLPMLEVEVS